MNRRDEILRGAVSVAYKAKGTEGFRAACEAVVDCWIEYPYLRAVELEKRDVVAEGLEALRESTAIVEEAAVLRALRAVATEICVMCEAPNCKGGPDCMYRQRISMGVSERVAKWRRGVEWRELIEKREAAHAA